MGKPKEGTRTEDGNQLELLQDKGVGGRRKGRPCYSRMSQWFLSHSLLYSDFDTSRIQGLNRPMQKA